MSNHVSANLSDRDLLTLVRRIFGPATMSETGVIAFERLSRVTRIEHVREAVADTKRCCVGWTDPNEVLQFLKGRIVANSEELNIELAN